MHSDCLKELDLSGNEIGNLASLLLLEAMEARKESQFINPILYISDYHVITT